MVKLVNVLGLICLVAGAQAADWNYDQNDGTNGPAGWSTGDCGGSSQSPIDFATVTEAQKPAWTLTGWDSTTTYTVTNSGYTVKFTPDSSSITTAGGGFSMAYNFAQFHFHWGANNDKGSEHTVNGESYPLEVHFVHYKSQYADLNAAVGASDDASSLAAVGFFFEISVSDNAALTDVLNGVQSAQDASSEVSNVAMNTLLQFTGSVTTGDFYRYNGGLTTPGCNEQVLWTVFTTPIPISQAQLDIFRNVNTTDSELYRPTQPVNGRTVTKYTDVSTTTASEGQNPRTTTSGSGAPTLAASLLVFTLARLAL